MFTIRFHGRGGQGMKTASRMLGSAFFLEGFEVQDAPRYGAERRGAPMSAYVRADHQPIHARGVIAHPGLVIAADDSLVPMPAAGVLAGILPSTVLLIFSRVPESIWRDRLNLQGPVLIIPPAAVSSGSESALISAACAGAAACLTGVIGRETLIAAIRDELDQLGPELLNRNLDVALNHYDRMMAWKGVVKASVPVRLQNYQKPAWIDLPLESSLQASPTIQGAPTSTLVRTGLWRTQRPVIDYSSCRQCWWICSNFCPDSAISLDADGFPVIDYAHCKGCMICVAQCPSHAIHAVAEAEAQRLEQQGEPR
ncbi:MAG: 2-oxoacid:acceptor oxidoreductase family protein [Gammaproteobacteria bacterium]